MGVIFVIVFFEHFILLMKVQSMKNIQPGEPEAEILGVEVRRHCLTLLCSPLQKVVFMVPHV